MSVEAISLLLLWQVMVLQLLGFVPMFRCAFVAKASLSSPKQMRESMFCPFLMTRQTGYSFSVVNKS